MDRWRAVLCVVFLMNIEQGDRTAVLMSVISLTLMLSLNITVTNSLFFSWFSSLSLSLPIYLFFSHFPLSLSHRFVYLIFFSFYPTLQNWRSPQSFFLHFFNFSLSLFPLTCFFICYIPHFSLSSSCCIPPFSCPFQSHFTISLLFLFCFFSSFSSLLLFICPVHLVLCQRQWWWRATSWQWERWTTPSTPPSPARSRTSTGPAGTRSPPSSSVSPLALRQHTLTDVVNLLHMCRDPHIIE